MIANIIKNKSSLLTKSTASIMIYLRNHNQNINPPKSILKVSYRNPKNLYPDAPTEPFH